MKIKVKKVIGGFFIMALITANLFFGSISKADTNPLSLKNVEALHASAGETYCDQSSNSTCTIIVDGTVGKSIGRIVGSF